MQMRRQVHYDSLIRRLRVGNVFIYAVPFLGLAPVLREAFWDDINAAESPFPHAVLFFFESVLSIMCIAFNGLIFAIPKPSKRGLASVQPEKQVRLVVQKWNQKIAVAAVENLGADGEKVRRGPRPPSKRSGNGKTASSVTNSPRVRGHSSVSSLTMAENESVISALGSSDSRTSKNQGTAHRGANRVSVNSRGTQNQSKQRNTDQCNQVTTLVIPGQDYRNGEGRGSEEQSDSMVYENDGGMDRISKKSLTAISRDADKMYSSPDCSVSSGGDANASMRVSKSKSPRSMKRTLRVAVSGTGTPQRTPRLIRRNIDPQPDSADQNRRGSKGSLGVNKVVSKTPSPAVHSRLSVKSDALDNENSSNSASQQSSRSTDKSNRDLPFTLEPLPPQLSSNINGVRGQRASGSSSSESNDGGSGVHDSDSSGYIHININNSSHVGSAGMTGALNSSTSQLNESHASTEALSSTDADDTKASPRVPHNQETPNTKSNGSSDANTNNASRNNNKDSSSVAQVPSSSGVRLDAKATEELTVTEIEEDDEDLHSRMAMQAEELVNELTLSRDLAMWWRNPDNFNLDYFFTFPSPINEGDSRLHALCSSVLIAVSCITFALDLPPIVPIYLSFGYMCRMLSGPKVDIQSYIVLFVIKPYTDDWNLFNNKFSSGRPKRLSQVIGFSMSTCSLILMLLLPRSDREIAFWIYGALWAANSMSGVFNICLACTMVNRLMYFNILPKDYCKDCRANFVVEFLAKDDTDPSGAPAEMGESTRSTENTHGHINVKGDNNSIINSKHTQRTGANPTEMSTANGVDVKGAAVADRTVDVSLRVDSVGPSNYTKVGV